MVEKATLRTGLPVGNHAGTVVLKDGALTVPTTLRQDAFAVAEAVDAQAGNRFDIEPEGRTVVFLAVRVPGYENKEEDDRLVVPLIIPVLGRDGVWAPVFTGTQDIETESREVATAMAGCSFGYVLPDALDPLFCGVPDIAPALAGIQETTPNVVVGAGLVEASIEAPPAPLASPPWPVGVFGASTGSAAPSGLAVEDLPMDLHRLETLGPAARAPASQTLATSSDPRQVVLSPAASSSTPLPWWVVPLASVLGLALPVWVLYRRLQTKSCLSEFRTELLRAIRASPGIQPADLSRRFGLSFKTIGHHLAVLRSFGHVDLERRGNALHVFERGVHPQVVKGLYVSRQPTRLRVLRLVAARPGIGCSAMARELGMSKPGVHSHLKALERDRVLQRRGRRGWEVAPEAQQAWHVVAEVAQVAPQPPAAGPIS